MATNKNKTIKKMTEKAIKNKVNKGIKRNQPLFPVSCILLTPTANPGIKKAKEKIKPKKGKPIIPPTKPNKNEKIKLNNRKYQNSLLLALPLKVA